MSGQAGNSKKLSLTALILMIFTSVFGFANMPRSFYKMGYGSILWFIFAAVAFFIPYAFMMAEYGAAFKDEKGGIYSWMEKSIGAKFAFVGTFMWYASYLVWMVNVSSGIWIPLSNSIFGEDRTQTWSMFGLNSTQFLGVLAIIWIVFVTVVASRGLSKISKITSIGGTAVALLNVLLLVGAVIVIVGNHGQFAEPLTLKAFVQSPNPGNQSTMGILGFVVYAIFAFGGIEVVGGLVDQTENSEKNFPKGLALSAIIISIGYAIGLFLCGAFINWNDVLASDNVHLANVAYVMMQNLGTQIGLALGLTHAASLTIGLWIARFVGLSMFLALTGAFFTLSYAPLKQLIEGTPKKLWPGKLAELKDGMPKNAMKVQGIIVIVIIAIVALPSGDGAKEFFQTLVNMTNVALTIPYIFLSFAFIAFKKNDSINKPYVAFKSKKGAIIASWAVTLTVGLANVFTIIEPLFTTHKYADTVAMIAGPVVFTILALLLFKRYEKIAKNDSENVA